MTGSGNVGIGTTTPLYKLHVQDAVYFPSGIISPGIQAQSVLSGGGVVTWTGASLKWSFRVIALPVEKAEFANNGYIDIECPLSGTIVSYAGTTGVSTVTCNANGIPMSSWTALWYVIAVGQVNTSVQSNFVLTTHTNDLWRPTSNWLLIAVLNGDTTNGGHLKWMPGQVCLPYTGGVYDSKFGTQPTSHIGSFTTSTSVTIGDFDLSNYYSVQIRINYALNGANNGNVSISSFRDTANNVCTLYESYTVELKSTGGVTNTGSGAYLASNREIYGNNYGAIITIWSTRPGGTGGRYSFTFEGVGCFAGVGATTNKGQGWTSVVSGTISKLVITTSAGTFSGNYSIAHYL